MRPFTFRPQPALDLRVRAQDAAEQALARAQAETRAAAAALTEARAEIDRAHAEHRAAWDGADALVRGEWHRNWMVGLQRNVARARAVLEERRIEERRAAEIAREARKQVKVLERLKARTLQAWALEARRAEQKALDELASLRFASRRRAGQERDE
jgi:flagellar export protein FliJ